MIMFHRYEGKNLDTLKEDCLKELNESLENLYFYTEEVDAGLFKGKKYILEVISKNEIKEYIKNYISELSKKINIDITCEIRFDDNNINIMLISNNSNIIIGSNGKNLNALQILLRQSLKDLYKFNIKINLDASNYKEKRIKTLKIEINKICKDVLISGVEVKLDPMNSYERRIVHSVVSQFENLSSESYGIDPERYTVIRRNN